MQENGLRRGAGGWEWGGEKPRGGGGGGIFRTRPEQLWDTTSLLCNGYRVFPKGLALTTNLHLAPRLKKE